MSRCGGFRLMLDPTILSACMCQLASDFRPFWILLIQIFKSNLKLPNIALDIPKNRIEADIIILYIAATPISILDFGASSKSESKILPTSLLERLRPSKFPYKTFDSLLHRSPDFSSTADTTTCVHFTLRGFRGLYIYTY